MKYTQDNFRHFEADKRRPSYSSELILSNGFKLFGLIKNYTDLAANNEESSK